MAHVSREGDEGCVSSVLDAANAPETVECKIVSTSSEALVDEPKTDEFRLRDVKNLGVVVHTWSCGFGFGAIGEILAGVFLGYLNMPSYLFSTALGICNMPLAFSFVYGVLSDTLPIRGLHRKPYLMIGWTINVLALLPLALVPMPAPYYCVSAQQTYEMNVAPCNPEARDSFTLLVCSFFFLVLGTNLAQASATGLLIDYAKREPEEKRGTAQMNLSMVHQLGGFCATFLTAFGFNGTLYTGSVKQSDQLSFRQLSGILLGLSAVTLLSTCCFVQELPRKAEKQDVKRQARASWDLLGNKGFFFVAAYNFLRSSVFSISTPAVSYIGLQWADVKMLQRQFSNLMCILATVLGYWVARKYCLQASWRKIMCVATVFTLAVDAVQQYCTIFDIIRSPYFYLGEPLVAVIPQAATDLVTTLLANELADDTNGALVSGILGTVSSVGAPVGTVLSNQIFGEFKPDLNIRKNFIDDTDQFRRTVAWSYAIQGAVSIASLFLLFLLPQQKLEARRRKQEWGSHHGFATVTVAVLLASLAYALLVDVIALDPDLSCMKFVGGPGC